MPLPRQTFVAYLKHKKRSRRCGGNRDELGGPREHGERPVPRGAEHPKQRREHVGGLETISVVGGGVGGGGGVAGELAREQLCSAAGGAHA